MTKQKFVTIILLSVIATSALSDSKMPDSFSVELQYLQRQNAAKTGIPAYIDAYEKFIEKYQPDARVAAAMFDLGVIYESDWTGQDDDKALEYFAAAAQTAVPNTEIWKRANIFLFNRLLNRDIHRAEQVLVDIKAHLKEGDTLFYMSVEEKYIDLHGIQRQFDEAEKHFGNLISASNDPQRRPENWIEKSEAHNILLVSVAKLIAYINNAPDLTTSKKLLLLQSIGKKYYMFTQIDQYRRVMERLEAQLNSEAMSVAKGQIANLEHPVENSIAQTTSYNETNENLSEEEPDDSTVAEIESPTGVAASEERASLSTLQIGIPILIVSASLVILACLVRKWAKETAGNPGNYD